MRGEKVQKIGGLFPASRNVPSKRKNRTNSHEKAIKTHRNIRNKCKLI